MKLNLPSIPALVCHYYYNNTEQYQTREWVQLHVPNHPLGISIYYEKKNNTFFFTSKW